MQGAVRKLSREAGRGGRGGLESEDSGVKEALPKILLSTSLPVSTDHIRIPKLQETQN